MRTAGALLLAGLLTAACSGNTIVDGEPIGELNNVRLVAFSGCDDMLAGLRQATAKNVTPWGLGPIGPYAIAEDTAAAASTGSAKQATPDHSTTNVHEAGVDEPDMVKTDGKRVITVSGGTLRVVDAATRRVTGTLRLVPKDQRWRPADLLFFGDRALVLFQGGGFVPFGAVAKTAALDGPRYVLVDLAGAPRVLGSLTAHGTHVDARQVGSTVRIVVRSTPELSFPERGRKASDAEMLRANRETVMRAPIHAWLPRFEVESGGVTRTDKISCDRISHPAEYTGTSMLAVHTVDLAGSFGSVDPIGVAADGDTVYGTHDSLYVTSNPRWWFPTPVDGSADRVFGPAGREPDERPEETQVHRFRIGGTGAPAYVASGVVPGRLLNQYSLSEHAGHLRVATTSGAETFGDTRTRSESGVYVLNTDTLAEVGRVTGLGKGERIYSVRFIGELGYVVTFRQVDPLYTLDLRDPAAPKVTGELKITGFSAYLHPGGDGRLIGVGQEASRQGRTLGTQVSLFDVRDPASPTVLARFHQRRSGSEAEWDPHAFLYWPASGLAMLPLANYDRGWADGSAALVLNVTDGGITKIGEIRHPRFTGRSDFAWAEPGIRRCLVIGDDIWTLSDVGLKVSDARTLADRAWIPFA